MSIMNSYLMRMFGGQKDKNGQDQQPQQPKQNSFGQSGELGANPSDDFTRYLLQGGGQPAYSLGDYGSSFFSGNNPPAQEQVPLSWLTTKPQQPTNRQPQGNFTYLKGLI